MSARCGERSPKFSPSPRRSTGSASRARAGVHSEHADPHLQCLDRPHRIAYVPGEIFEWAVPEAAEARGIEAPAFRKRLERARQAIEDFTRAHCGLVSETATCACHRRVPAAIGLGRVDIDHPRFARAGVTFADAREFVRRVDETKRVIRLQQSNEHRGAHRDFAQFITSALDLGQ